MRRRYARCVILLGLLTLCVATVPVLGGRIGRLSTVKFRRRWAGVAAVLVQMSILRVFPDGDSDLLALLHVASYGFLLSFVLGNLHVPGITVIGLGGILNALAITANNGVMPADPEALERAGILSVHGDFANSAAVSHPNLWVLGDIFAVPDGFPMANVFSIGDLVLVLGAFILLHRVCGSLLARPMERASRWLRGFFFRVEILRDNQPFRRLWIAQAISGIGDWVFPPAVFAALVGSNATSSDLALLLIVQVGPGMVVGMVGGPIIDRFSRRLLMVGTDLMRALAVGSLLIGGTPSLAHVYVVSLCLGIGGALFQPAFLATLPNLVTRRQLASANALVGLTQSLAVMIGFPLGGFLVGTFGAGWAFSINMASFAFSALLIARTPVPHGVYRATESLVTGLRDGFRHVRANKRVLRVIFVVGMITLAAGIKSPLEPLFALDSLDAGPTGLGVLGAVWGAGMLIGSAMATWVDRRIGHEAMLAGAVALVSVAVIMASFCPVLAPVLVLWLVGGMGNSAGTVAYETLLQEATPDNIRGRVMAVLEASLQGGLLIGVAIAALTDTVFRGSDPARAGMLLAGAAFGIAALVSWRLIGRRTPVPPPFAVRTLELLRPTAHLGLVRVTAELRPDDPAPVLLIEDGGEVHRVEALPGGRAQVNGTRKIGYGVPSRLLEAPLSLDGGALGRMVLAQGSGTSGVRAT
jgi:MFS family permease